MKYIRKTKKEITSNFLEELLIDRGILSKDDTPEFRHSFFYPTL
nr:MAG TPA: METALLOPROTEASE, VIBRIO CHOLERAE, PRTV, N-TERMINAL [Caudoviricetes sp.]